MDPNAPKEPLEADAQAEADGGDDEAPPDVESDDGSVAGSSPLPPAGPLGLLRLSPLLSVTLRPAWECRVESRGGPRGARRGPGGPEGGVTTSSPVSKI